MYNNSTLIFIKIALYSGKIYYIILPRYDMSEGKVFYAEKKNE